MNRRTRWIFAVAVLLLLMWALVRLDVWYAARQADPAPSPPAQQETAP